MTEEYAHRTFSGTLTSITGSEWVKLTVRSKSVPVAFFQDPGRQIYQAKLSRNSENLELDLRKLTIKQNVRTGTTIEFEANLIDAPEAGEFLWVHGTGAPFEFDLIPLNDDSTPVIDQARAEAKKAVTRAVMLCNEHDFQMWFHLIKGLSTSSEPDIVTDALKDYLGVASRSHLQDNPEARGRLTALISEFTDYLNRRAYEDFRR